MYTEDAVVEFPQSGERFAGVENLREWRSSYPANTSFEFREVRGRDDFWVAELSISYGGGPANFGVGILELRGDNIARESVYVTEGLRRRSGGLDGGLRPKRVAWTAVPRSPPDRWNEMHDRARQSPPGLGVAGQSRRLRRATS